MRLDDPTHGLKDSELEQVQLTGQTLADHRAFWDRSAQVDAIRAIADQQDEAGFEESGRPEREALAPLLRSTDRVLEIGCGIGRVLQHVATLCAEVHGIDISTEMVAAGRRRLAHQANVHFHVGNGYDLAAFEDGSFDAVYSIFVLQHVPKTTAFNYLAEAQRVLKDGGLLWFQVPNVLRDDHFHAFHHFSQPHFVHHPYPMHFFTPSEVCSWLLRLGFHVDWMDDYVVVHARKGAPGLAPEVEELVARSGGLLPHLLEERDRMAIRATEAEQALDRLRGHPVVRIGSRLRRALRR